MASSAVEICNEALALVGAESIASLSDNVTTARLLNSLYVGTKEELLVSHPWKFATKRLSLAVDTDAPAYEYSYRFLLPTDCLRVIGTDLGTEAEWTEENGYLLCNESEVNIKYISKITTEATFSVPFCEALAYKLASKIAYPLVQSSTLAQGLFQQYLIHMKDAKSMNAQAAQGQIVEANDWLYSRY
jgi:hypothetical protein